MVARVLRLLPLALVAQGFVGHGGHHLQHRRWRAIAHHHHGLSRATEPEEGKESKEEAGPKVVRGEFRMETDFASLAKTVSPAKFTKIFRAAISQALSKDEAARVQVINVRGGYVDKPQQAEALEKKETSFVLMDDNDIGPLDPEKETAVDFFINAVDSGEKPDNSKPTSLAILAKLELWLQTLQAQTGMQELQKLVVEGLKGDTSVSTEDVNHALQLFKSARFAVAPPPSPPKTTWVDPATGPVLPTCKQFAEFDACTGNSTECGAHYKGATKTLCGKSDKVCEQRVQLVLKTCCNHGAMTTQENQNKCGPMFLFFAASPTCEEWDNREKDKAFSRKVNETCDKTYANTDSPPSTDHNHTGCRNKFENIYQHCGHGCKKHQEEKKDFTAFSSCVWEHMQKAPSEEVVHQHSSAFAVTTVALGALAAFFF